MYNCRIIDDEPIAIRVIKNHLSAFTDFNLVAECNNAIEAMPVLSKERLSHLAETLPASWFIQIHRSYIVSISKIESVGPGCVKINKKKLPVGRSYKPELSKLLENNKS